MPVSFSYDWWGDIWPGYNNPVPLAPVRIGVDRQTFKPIAGFRHVFQSMTILYATRYHSRVLRRWVGSLVPHLLGELTTQQNITKFYYAFASALDLFEPGYQIRRVYVAQLPNSPSNIEGRQLTSANEIRKGGITFRHDGVYMPRGHLGDRTSEDRRRINLLQREGRWEVQP